MITRRPPVDWFRIMAELKRCGLSQGDVARILRVSRNRVKHWPAGKSPDYDDGRALIMLWRRVMLAEKRRLSKLSPKGQRISVQTGHGTTAQPIGENRAA